MVNPEDLLSHSIIGCAIEAHKELGGSGLLESVYEEALAWELDLKGHMVQRQTCVPILYKGKSLATPLRVDLMVNELIVVECKSSIQISPKTLDAFKSQLLTYFKLTNLRLGLLINFGETCLKNGIHRVVNNLPE
ncbi:GxxExxY protein [candidate division BRC1 bacterium HGW-BRC1-1]|nr:MAG: GxxExxY protein [candidate division BRC1 bacterium HGW-BRC1-1]